MVMSKLYSAINTSAETASSLSSSIHSTFADNYPNISKNITENYSSLSNKFFDNYSKFSEHYPYFATLTSTKSNIATTFNNGTNYLYSLPSSIGTTVQSYTSMLQPVDVTDEREVTRTDPNSNLGENVIELNEERVELVNYILDIYSCNLSKGHFKYYDENVVFSDPLLHTTGLSNLKAQFYGMPKLFSKSTTESYKILENNLLLLKIDLHQKYTLPFISRAVVHNSVIVLEFNDGKIVKHSDLWYGKKNGEEGMLRKAVANIVATLVKVPDN